MRRRVLTGPSTTFAGIGMAGYPGSGTDGSVIEGTQLLEGDPE
ncbi:hypothetical protein [Natrinema zhouii]|nr:hypothetical protein [Natrinema zhouii]